jgi:hypothetical protein
LNYAEAEQGRPKVNLLIERVCLNVILSIAKDLGVYKRVDCCTAREILHYVQNDNA